MVESIARVLKRKGMDVTVTEISKQSGVEFKHVMAALLLCGADALLNDLPLTWLDQHARDGDADEKVDSG